MNRFTVCTSGVLGVCLAAAPALSAQGSGFTMRNGDYLGAVSVAPDPDLKRIPELKICDPKHQLVGYIRGDGIITYVITAEGRADTASIKVMSHQGVSAGTLASVATRVLPTCTFRAAETTRGKAPALVSQRLIFHSAENPAHGQTARVLHSTLILVPGTDLMLKGLDSTTDSLASLAPDSTGVDEEPVSLGCDYYHFSHFGDVTASFIIGTDGRIELLSLSPDSAHPASPAMYTAARKVLQSCHFIPGRRDGVLVGVKGWGVLYSTDRH